ncbi:MAG: hypothetical protein HYV07_04325 [Deltaproteobacteria bacterium]|nr:hypothetical protein [Deltaproteobacteria bacterium]
MTIYVVGAAAISALGPLGRSDQGALRRPREACRSQVLLASHPHVDAFEVPLALTEPTALDAKRRKMMARPSLLASWAVARALDDCHWKEVSESVSFHLAVGSGNGPLSDLEAVARACVQDGAASMEALGSKGLQATNPLSAFQILNNFTLCHAAIRAGIRGPNTAIFSRGVGTVSALVEARDSIVWGGERRVLVGAADSALHALTWEALEVGDFVAAHARASEGAAVLALSPSAEGAVARLEACDVFERADAASLSAHGAGRVILTGRGALEPFVRQTLTARGLDVLEATEVFGEALAATPALAWTWALEDLAAGQADRVLVASLSGEAVGVAAFAHKDLRPSSTRRTRASPTRAVMTGVGVVSAFGAGVDPFFRGLQQGRSGVAPITRFDARTFPVRVAAEAPSNEALVELLAERTEYDESLARWARRGDLRDRKVILAASAVDEAWRRAGCSKADLGAWLSFATGLEEAWFDDFAAIWGGDKFRFDRSNRSKPHLRSSMDRAPDCARELLGLTGRRVIDCSACAAGALSVARAAAWIESRETSIAIAGGVDSMVNPIGVGGFYKLGATSPRSSQDACRPFDRNRDGIVIGEGAAFFVIESEERARARGALPIARVLGFGGSHDAFHPAAPRPDGAGASAAMSRALSRARLDPAQVGWVNAHGTGTRLNDEAEATAIRSTFGRLADTLPVSSIKGAVGHLMAASGAIELASCLIAFDRGLLAGTAHHVEPDPDCPIQVIGASPRAQSIEAVLSNSFGFGGQNVSVILGVSE